MRRKSQKVQPFLLLTTVSSRKEATKLGQVLLRHKRAACVNIIPGVNSLFWWKGSVDRAREFLLLIKTDRRQLSKVEKLIRDHHSYEVPEMIGWPIRWGHKPYLKWLSTSVSK